MFSLPHNRRTWMPAFSLTMLIAATLLLGIRLFSRIRRNAGTFGLDDVFVTLGWAAATVANALVLLGE